MISATTTPSSGVFLDYVEVPVLLGFTVRTQGQMSVHVSAGSTVDFPTKCLRRVVRRRVMEEMFRVLKPGGRVSITDIVSGKQLSQSIVNDPKLWAS